MAAVVAVDEIIPPTAPEASIPPRSHITRERMYHVYCTPVMITTKNQTLYGLKNLSNRIGCVHAKFPGDIYPIKSIIENF